MDGITLFVIVFCILLPILFLIWYAHHLKKQRERDRAMMENIARRESQARTEKDRQEERHRAFVAQQRRLMSDSMRYDVLRRDNFRCQICGATQKDGVKLHVDHIVPVSKGGRTEMSNLRTLCERCNMGKGAKLE